MEIAQMILSKPQNLWNISLFVLREGESVFDCVSRKPDKRFTPQNLVRTKYHQITGYADPFLFENQKDGFLYLFYEEEHLKSDAPICAKRTTDLKHWENLGVVLKEQHHLSYPYVFEYNDDIFMLPETRVCKAVILYKATQFPYRWEPFKELVKGDMFADSCIVSHNERWNLFTTAWYGKKNGLRVFISDDLLGKYEEHPLSPITDDIAASRCGGAVFSYEGHLYRPAQYCTNYYGENLHVYKIDELSPSHYQEHFFKQMIDKKQIWNTFGGHHLNTIVYQGKQVVVMDGIVNDNWLNNHTRKLFNFYYNHIR